MARMRQIAATLDDSERVSTGRPPAAVFSSKRPIMLGHAMGCTCQRCAPPIVIDARRVVLGFLGLCVVAVWLWLVWIALPA